MHSFCVHQLLSCAGILRFANDLVCFLHDLIKTLVIRGVRSASFGLYGQDTLLYPLANLVVLMCCNHISVLMKERSPNNNIVCVVCDALFIVCVFVLDFLIQIKRKNQKGEERRRGGGIF